MFLSWLQNVFKLDCPCFTFDLQDPAWPWSSALCKGSSWKKLDFRNGSTAVTLMTRVSNDVSFTWGQVADWCFFGFLFGFAVKWERFGRLFLCIFLVHEPTESELVPINASYFFVVANFVSSSILSRRRLLEKKWSVFSLTYFPVSG